MPGGAQRGARAHRVPDQDDGNRAEPVADFVQDPAEIVHWRSLVAVPAPEHEPRPADHGAAPPQRLADGSRDRDHPDHRRLGRRGRFGAHRPAPVRDHDDTGDTGDLAAATGARKRLAARHDSSRIPVATLQGPAKSLPAGLFSPGLVRLQPPHFNVVPEHT
jgi:hypothetical protein